MAADSGGALSLLGILFAAYFAPTIIAVVRRHHNAAAIAMLNILLGWTLLGWIIAFVWSCTATIRDVQAQVRAADLAAQRPELRRRTDPTPKVFFGLLLCAVCVGLVIAYQNNERTQDQPSPAAKADPDATAVPNDRPKKPPKPKLPSLEQEARAKYGPRLTEATNLIEKKQFAAAKKILREIIDDAPMTNLTIEARQLLNSVPPEK